MSTFTTKDREEFMQDVHVQNKFVFRFIKEGDEWVCKMPDWLLKEAQKIFHVDQDLADYQKQAAQLWNDSCTSNRKK